MLFLGTIPNYIRFYFTFFCYAIHFTISHSSYCNKLEYLDSVVYLFIETNTHLTPQTIVKLAFFDDTFNCCQSKNTQANRVYSYLPTKRT